MRASGDSYTCELGEDHRQQIYLKQKFRSEILLFGSTPKALAKLTTLKFNMPG